MKFNDYLILSRCTQFITPCARRTTRDSGKLMRNINNNYCEGIRKFEFVCDATEYGAKKNK